MIGYVRLVEKIFPLAELYLKTEDASIFVAFQVDINRDQKCELSMSFNYCAESKFQNACTSPWCNKTDYLQSDYSLF